MIRRLHPVFGLVAFLAILTFWLATVVSELWGDVPAITAVKRSIAWGLLLLVPTLMATAVTGFRLGGRSPDPLVVRKRRRMPLIAANGIVVLAPAAVTLAILSARGDFGTSFVVVQAVELVAGAVNLTLIGLGIRDGRRLAARRRARAAAA